MLKEDKIKLLKELVKHTGWKVLEELQHEKLSTKEKRLRTCSDYELDKIQGYIEGIEFIFKEVERLIRGE